MPGAGLSQALPLSQRTVLDAVQSVVAHSVGRSCTLAVKSWTPKLSPKTVRTDWNPLRPPMFADGAKADRSGASRVKSFAAVELIDASVATVFPDFEGLSFIFGDSRHAVAVLDVHVDVSHGKRDIVRVIVPESLPKFRPITMTDEPPVTATLELLTPAVSTGASKLKSTFAKLLVTGSYFFSVRE